MLQATPILDSNGFILPIVLKYPILNQGGEPPLTLERGLFEVVDKESPYFGLTLNANGGIFEYKHPNNLQTGVLLEINDMRHTEEFLFHQIKKV